jgi:hypothetical protein
MQYRLPELGTIHRMIAVDDLLGCFARGTNGDASSRSVWGRLKQVEALN